MRPAEPSRSELLRSSKFTEECRESRGNLTALKERKFAASTQSGGEVCGPLVVGVESADEVCMRNEEFERGEMLCDRGL